MTSEAVQMLVGHRMEGFSCNGMIRIEGLLEAPIDHITGGVVQQHGRQQGHGRVVIVVAVVAGVGRVVDPGGGI